MALIAVKLRALVLLHGILDGQRMQPEFLAQHGKVLVVRVAQVKPDGNPFIGEMITDLGYGETLELEPAVPVKPRAGLAPGRSDLAEGGCGHGVRITAVERPRQRRPGPQHAAGRAARIARPTRISPVAHHLAVAHGGRAARTILAL